MSVYSVGSLFAGIGGICLGFQRSKIKKTWGFKLAWANEFDEYACHTYRNNFDHLLLQGDINLILNPELEQADNRREEFVRLNEQINSKKIDVLTGGFPCQAFSIAGERKGFEDERGNLFLSIIQLVKQLESKHGKPRVLFLENVRNLVGHDGGRTYSIIKSQIEQQGYIVKDVILNTMHYSDLPQNRERIYIICFRDERDAEEFNLENITSYRREYSIDERKEQFLQVIDEVESREKYFYNKKKYPRYFFEKNETIGSYINLHESITKPHMFYQIRRGMYVRENKSGVCPALTANMGTGGHNVPLVKTVKGIRKITPDEALRLQGFPVPDKFVVPVSYGGRPFADSHVYKQAGNAVSVSIIQLFADEILRVFREVDLEKHKNKKK